MREGPEKNPLVSKHIKHRLRVIRQAGNDGVEGEDSGELLKLYEFYDSPRETYDDFFKGLIAPHATLAEFVEHEYADKKGDLVAIELGGPAHKLFRGFPPDLFKHTAGFALTDQRSKSERAKDTKRSHDVVVADVFFRSGTSGTSFNAIDAWVKEHGKPDIVIECMVQPLDMIRDKEIFQAILSRWYRLLADGGTMLIEVPKKIPEDQIQSFRRELAGWADSNSVDIRFQFDTPRKSLLMRRHIRSPQK